MNPIFKILLVVGNLFVFYLFSRWLDARIEKQTEIEWEEALLKEVTR